MPNSRQLLSFAPLFFALMPSMLVLWELYQSPYEHSQTFCSWLITSIVQITNDSIWRHFAWFDCLFGILVAVYYGLQWSFGELSEDEVTAVGETLFNFLTVKVIWTFFCIDIDIWEVMIWATWFMLNCVLLSLSTILRSQAKSAINGTHRTSLIYDLVLLVLSHLFWLWVIWTTYSLFWVELSALPKGSDFIIQITLDAWLTLLNILRVDAVFFYWRWCTHTGAPCNQHIVHSLNFVGSLLNQFTLFLTTLHFWIMKGFFIPTVTWLLIIWLVHTKLTSIVKLVKDYWSYYVVLRRINNCFPEAPLAKIRGEVCSICREELKPGAKVVPCGHIFDASCLEAWMRMKRECPNCRTSLEVQEAAPDPTTTGHRLPSTLVNFRRWITQFFTQTSRRAVTGAFSREVTPDNLHLLGEMFPEHTALEISGVFRRMGTVEASMEHFLRNPPEPSTLRNVSDTFGTNPYAQSEQLNTTSSLDINPYAPSNGPDP